MAGKNPYIEEAEVPKPTKPYTITFLPMNKTVQVNPEEIPYTRTGQPGSILDIALAHGISVEHVCGGVCACSTCHVIVRQGFDSIPEASDDEEDQLDNAPGLEITSRLACQSVPDGSEDIVVEIPGWNRNAVQETPHDH